MNKPPASKSELPPESNLFYNRSPYKEAFDIDFPNEPLPGEMYKYRCLYCKVLTTDINGLLENHKDGCEYKALSMQQRAEAGGK